MELQPLKIHFFPKLRAAGTDTYTLYMRMVLSGKRADLSLGYELKSSDWDKNTQSLKGKHPNRVYVLNMTNKHRQNAQEAYQQLIQRGMAYDVNIIRERISGADKKNTSVEPTLFKQFNRIIERKKSLAGNNNSKGLCCMNIFQCYQWFEAYLEAFDFSIHYVSAIPDFIKH